ncbi:hypothetical protein [Arthrobacter alpinus]|uniref:hypothetical protein n=1 Tax=Arthrobacter alpinus TaxID=656366 RepID=UPI000A5AE616|nr:hypothetical protein [Arthrobacter alpinus]
MSKETDPVRSRRELRSAKPEQSTGAAGYPSVPMVAAPPVPPVDRTGRRTSTPSPQPAPDVRVLDDAAQAQLDEPTPAARPNAVGDGVVRERSSQTRARDRAALRAYKELLDPGPQPVVPLPSRRALRQAQLEAERAPITSVNPVVPPAATLPPVQAPALPAVEPTTPAQQAAVTAPPLPPKQAPSTPAVPDTTRSRAGRRVAPSPAAVEAVAPTLPAQPATKPVAAHAAPAAPETAGDVSATGTVGATVGGTAAAGPTAVVPPAVQPPAGQPPATGNYPPTEGLVPGGAYHPVSAGPPAQLGQAPSNAELQALAEQRAQAERTAILNQRAQARERLAQESAKSRRPPSDPTATNNLAMVTPLEFVDVPGVDRPVLRPPVTTHVPIITRSTPRQRPATDPQAERFDAAMAPRAVHRPGPGNRPLTGGRSSTLKRAEEMVSVVPGQDSAPAESVTRTQMPPIPAEYAHGLEPLDAVTAGLGRTHRNMLLQWGSIILGGAALVAGAVVFITALVR